tara:strand:- start:221 stop:3475 length:3255 start_codon:yes stop_codon:yes gene_type:complete
MTPNERKRSDEKKVQAIDSWLENDENSHKQYNKYELNELDIRMRVRMKPSPENPQRMQYEKKITPETMLVNPTSDTDTKTIDMLNNAKNKNIPIEMEHESRFVIPTNHTTISENNIIEYLRERYKDNNLYKANHKYAWSDKVSVFRNEIEAKNYIKYITKKENKKKISLKEMSIQEVRDIYRLRLWEQVSHLIMSPKGYDSTSYGIASFLRDYHAYWKYLVYAYKEDVYSSKLRYSNSQKYVVDSKEYITRIGNVKKKINSLLTTPNILPIFSLGDIDSGTSNRSSFDSFYEKNNYSQIEANLGNIYHVLMMRSVTDDTSVFLAHDSFEMELFCELHSYDNDNIDLQTNQHQNINQHQINTINLLKEHPVYESIKHAYSTINASNPKDLFSIFEKKMAPMAFNYMTASSNDEDDTRGCSNLHVQYDFRKMYRKNLGNKSLISNDIKKSDKISMQDYHNDIQSILDDKTIIDIIQELKINQEKDSDEDKDTESSTLGDKHDYDYDNVVNSNDGDISNKSSNHKGKYFINKNILKNMLKRDKSSESDIQDLYRIHSYIHKDNLKPNKKKYDINQKVSDDDIFLKCFRENVLYLSDKTDTSEAEIHRKFKWNLLRKFVNYYTGVIHKQIKYLQDKIDKNTYDINHVNEYSINFSNMEREINKNRDNINKLTMMLSGKIPLAQMIPRRENLNESDGGIIRNDYPKFLKTDAYYAGMATIANAKQISKVGKRGNNNNSDYLNEIYNLWNKNFYFIPKNKNQNNVMSLDNNRICRYISIEQIEKYMNIHGLSKQYNYDQLLISYRDGDSIELAGINTEYDESFMKTTEDCQKGNDLNTLNDTMKNNIIQFIKLLIHNVPITIKNNQIRVKIDNPDNQIYVHPPIATGLVNISTMSRTDSYNTTKTLVKMIRPIILGACVPLKEYPNEDLDSLVNATKFYANDILPEIKTKIDKQCKSNANVINESVGIIKDSFMTAIENIKNKLDEEKESIRVSEIKRGLEKEKYNTEIASQIQDDIEDDGYDVYSKHKKKLKKHIDETAKHTTVLDSSKWNNDSTKSSDKSIKNKVQSTNKHLNKVVTGKTIRGLQITT